MDKLRRYGTVKRLQAVKVACIDMEKTPRLCICGRDAYCMGGGKWTCPGCGARVVHTDGSERMHDSILEWERSEYLLQLQAEGTIIFLEFHPHIEHFPGRPSGYTPDALYREGLYGPMVYEDVKGVTDDNWRWIVALWKGVNNAWIAPGVLREVKEGKKERAWVEKDYKPKGGE